MCGLAGYSGLSYLAAAKRAELVAMLGMGTDSRGGHASGWVSVGHKTRIERKVGPWASASWRWYSAAARQHTCLIHARYATSGDRDDVSNAHPFVVRRPDSPTLYGMHNGMLTGTHASAYRNHRSHTVDSRELYELLASGEIAAIRNLSGYGTLQWAYNGSADVYLCRLTDSADLEVCQLRDGGLVWGSTKRIVTDALDICGLALDYWYEPLAVGRTARVTDGVITYSGLDGLMVKPGCGWSWDGDGGWGGTWAKGTQWHVIHTLPQVADDTVWDRRDDDDPAWDEMSADDWDRYGRWAGEPPPKLSLDDILDKYAAGGKRGW